MSKPTVAGLITTDLIRELALPSNLKYGTAIHQRGAVAFINRTPDTIEGWAGGLDGTVVEGAGQRRRVTFTTNADGTLHWHCAGNPKDHQIFCKHCVALALTIQDTK